MDHSSNSVQIFTFFSGGNKQQPGGQVINHQPFHVIKNCHGPTQKTLIFYSRARWGLSGMGMHVYCIASYLLLLELCVLGF